MGKNVENQSPAIASCMQSSRKASSNPTHRLSRSKLYLWYDFCLLSLGMPFPKVRFVNNITIGKTIDVVNTTTLISAFDLSGIKCCSVMNKKFNDISMLYYFNLVFQHYLQFVLSLLAWNAVVSLGFATLTEFERDFINMYTESWCFHGWIFSRSEDWSVLFGVMDVLPVRKHF